MEGCVASQIYRHRSCPLYPAVTAAVVSLILRNALIWHTLPPASAHKTERRFIQHVVLEEVADAVRRDWTHGRTLPAAPAPATAAAAAAARESCQSSLPGPTFRPRPSPWRRGNIAFNRTCRMCISCPWGTRHKPCRRHSIMRHIFLLKTTRDVSNVTSSY